MIPSFGNQVLLHTKLHQPRVTADLVQRSRLKAALDDSLDRPLILVAAPAGFGKTTLASSWIEDLLSEPTRHEPIQNSTSQIPNLKSQIPNRPAWLSLDEADGLSLIHISEPTRPYSISYAVFCLKKKKKTTPFLLQITLFL